MVPSTTLVDRGVKRDGKGSGLKIATIAGFVEEAVPSLSPTPAFGSTASLQLFSSHGDARNEAVFIAMWVRQEERNGDPEGRASAMKSSMVCFFSHRGSYRGGKKVKDSQHYPPQLGTAVAAVYRRYDADLKLSFKEMSERVEHFAAGRNDAELLNTVMCQDLSEKPGWSDADLMSVLRHLCPNNKEL